LSLNTATGRRREVSRVCGAVLAVLAVTMTPSVLHAFPGDLQETPRSGSIVPAAPDLETMLIHLGERAKAYAAVALRFICIESSRTSDDPGKVQRYDYMYVEAEEQRYRPYRQKHTGRPGRGVAEARFDLSFPDSYSWTLLFSTERQHLLHFAYVGQEWFSLRLSHILEFEASLPFTGGRTIYEWGGRVWVDAENYNILKVEAEPGNQKERLKTQLNEYRRAPRFLIFPLARRPQGAKYSATFLNEYRGLSLPDQTEYRAFTLNLEGQEELGEVRTLRYAGYQFFDVDVIDKFLR
jgi:hypothetical protein